MSDRHRNHRHNDDHQHHHQDHHHHPRDSHYRSGADRGSGGWRRDRSRSRSRSPSPSRRTEEPRKEDSRKLSQEEERKARMMRLRMENEEEERRLAAASQMDDEELERQKRPQPKNEIIQVQQEELEGLDEEDQMKMLLGFSGFGSTSGQKVEDNQNSAARGAAAKNKARKYRQYMNRKNGFNRPLDKMD